MGRLFSCFLLSLMLLPAPIREDDAQPVFFSMLFPQLMPKMHGEKTIEEMTGEAVLL